MKISILSVNRTHRGPGKVYENLMLGLRNIPEVKVADNQFQGSDYYGFLQEMGDCWKQLDPAKTLFGPNIFVLPNHNPKICEHGSRFVVPCQWVSNMYRQFSNLDNKEIHIWPVGIDTKTWRPRQTEEKDLDCFVYVKNRTEEDLLKITKYLESVKLKYEIIRYGSYKEDELYNLCNRANFAILLTAMESQGIAYMQILSMNIPFYVFNWDHWISETNTKYYGTSVPYFNKQCGMVVDGLSFDNFKEFIDVRDSYKPRMFIETNHNIISSAKVYLNLLDQNGKR